MLAGEGSAVHVLFGTGFCLHHSTAPTLSTTPTRQYSHQPAMNPSVSQLAHPG